MDYDKNISPVGWYLGTYLLRFIELDDLQRDDVEKRFASWENTILVEAKSLDEAYEKVVLVAKQNSKSYRGGQEGVRVRWEYLGVTELVPIYERLGDGAEIAWADRAPRKLKSLKQCVKPKSAFRQ